MIPASNTTPELSAAVPSACGGQIHDTPSTAGHPLSRLALPLHRNVFRLCLSQQQASQPTRAGLSQREQSQDSASKSCDIIRGKRPNGHALNGHGLAASSPSFFPSEPTAFSYGLFASTMEPPRSAPRGPPTVGSSIPIEPFNQPPALLAIVFL